MFATVFPKPALVYAVCLVVLLLLQILVCLKCKKRLFKFVPLAISVITLIVMTVLFFTAFDWDKIGALFFILYAVAMMVACAFGWLISAIIKKLLNK